MAVEIWPIEMATVADLRLDPENVRIRGAAIDETAILNYLYLNDDVDELAHQILRDTYIDNEIPVVIEVDGKYVVMEGNRRISALKGLLDPSLVPARQAQLERLLRRYPGNDVPSAVRVMIAPDKEAVMPLLARLHTGQPKKGWPREQQATFYFAQYRGGRSIPELRQSYPIASGQLTRFIRMGEMNELLRHVKFDDDELAAWARRDLKMSSFEYAYSKPGIQQALGIAFTADGPLESHRIGPGLKAGLIHLVEGFRSGALNTRSPQLRSGDSQHAPFVEQLALLVKAADEAEGASDTPPHSGSPAGPGDHSGTRRGPGAGPSGSGGSGDAGDGGTGSKPGNSGDDPSAGDSGNRKRGASRRQVKRKLDFSGVDYSTATAGLQRRYEELSRLDLDWFPNAAYDLMRTVLECTIKDYFTHQPTSPLSPGAMLSECVRSLITHFQKAVPDPEMVRLLTALNQRNRNIADQFVGTAEALNHANHSPDAFVMKPDVHTGWDHMVPILRTLLSAMKPQPTS